MGKHFPLPREALPRLNVSAQELQNDKQIMQQLLAHTVQEFETQAYDQAGVVDSKRWKHNTTREDLTVYRERDSGATSSSLAKTLWNCELQRPPLSCTAAALASPSLMVTSQGVGKLEDAMGALVTKTQADLAVVVLYMNGGVSDCAIVETMEAPTAEQPLHFLGYKYFVKQAPANGFLFRHRHSIYLEYSGVTRSSTGEPLGFLLMHSVDIPEFPDLKNHKSVCILHSTRYIFRQKSDCVVESFMLTSVDYKGFLMNSLVSVLSLGGFFGCSRLLQLSEVRRLTQIARNRRQFGRRVSEDAVEGATAMVTKESCALCKVECKRKSKLEACPLCRQRVCRRCRKSKSIFMTNREPIMGEFIKVPVCIACVMHANKTNEQPSLQMSSYSHRESETFGAASVSTGSASEDPRQRVAFPDVGDHPILESGSSGQPMVLPSLSASQGPKRQDSSGSCQQQNGETSTTSQAPTGGVHMTPYVRDDNVYESLAQLEGLTSATENFHDTSSSSNSGSPSPGTASTMASSSTNNTVWPGMNPEQANLMAKMLELRSKVEATSMTTQQNGIYLAEQLQHLQLRTRPADYHDK